MRTVIHGNNPKYGFFSGIHGDEAAVTVSVAKVVEKYKDELESFLFIPNCSPSAVKLGTRNNAEGLDLNRSFYKSPKGTEAQEVARVISPYKFDLCVDFHEDTEHPGVYIYDYNNVEGSEKLTAFREQVRLVAPLFTGTDDENDHLLGGYTNDGYRVCNPPDKDEQGNPIYDGFLDQWALLEGKTKDWMTLEVPSGLSDAQKEQIVDSFFRTFILKHYN